MKKYLSYLLFFIFLSSCKTPAYLNINDCYIYKMNKEFGEVYSALTLVVSHYEYYLVLEDLKGQLSFNRDNVHLYIDSEYQDQPHFSIITQNGINKNQNVKVSEGYIWIKFLNVGSYPEKTSIQVKIEDIEYCNGERDCDKEEFTISFVYQEDKNSVMRDMKFRGFQTWWRDPGVDICLKEDSL